MTAPSPDLCKAGQCYGQLEGLLSRNRFGDDLNGFVPSGLSLAGVLLLDFLVWRTIPVRTESDNHYIGAKQTLVSPRS